MSGKPRKILRISQAQYDKMHNEVSRCAPEEACGIIAGKNGRAERVYVITNALHSPTAYRMEAVEQIAAFLEIERKHQEILAIFHSHPTGPGAPSETDLAEFAYPGVLTMIWFPKAGDWDCRVFSIEEMTMIEVELIINENE